MTGPATPIHLAAGGIDLSPRVQRTTTVVASPTDATETIIASLTINGNLALGAGILLIGWGAYTVGTNGVSCNLKLRRTDASGTTLAATGAVTRTAANLASGSVWAFDTGATLPGQVYVMTATLASASAASTFSAVQLTAIVV